MPEIGKCGCRVESDMDDSYQCIEHKIVYCTLHSVAQRYKACLEDLKGWIHMTANRRFEYWEEGLVEMDKRIDAALAHGQGEAK